MKTLRKVNTILFTIMSVILILLGMVFLFFSVQELIPIRYENNQSETFTDNLFEEDSTTYRKQRISIQSPILIDTISKKYLVPVELVSLQNPEQLHGLFDIDVRNLDNYNVDYSLRGGFANNYVILDQKNEKVEIIFDSKVFINRFKILSNREYILFEIIQEDNNEDGFLNSDDSKSFWIYSIATEKLHPIKLDSYIPIDFVQNNITNDVFITFAQDLNKNGRFESGREPTSIWKLNTGTYSLSPLINEKDLFKLQNIIDG